MSPLPSAPQDAAQDAAQDTAPLRRGRHAARRGAGKDTAPGTDSTASRRFLAKATLLSSALMAAGSVLGLGRDQALAHFFGASSDTDAFLVAWTVPEMAATLLIEGGMAFALVPAFSIALARRAEGAVPDPVRALITATLPRLCLALAAVCALVVAGAPLLVPLLAPGLPDPSLAVDCTRLTASSVLTFGVAGYCSAALRAHRSYLAPAAVSVALNVAIITAMLAFADDWGVRSAALGVGIGGYLMVAVQAPALWRRLTRGQQEYAPTQASGAVPLGAALITTVLLCALFRQAQVLIERFFGAGLPAGAISHLNYAQKVAQVPMLLALMLSVVTFPVLAQAIAQGDLHRARHRIERDLVLIASLVLVGAAVIVACAPQIIQLLFQRGAFTAADTAATASVMRVYTLGILGHTLVGALVRIYFSTGRAAWFPTVVTAAGMAATAGLAAWAVVPYGAPGIAGANAAGITLTALLLLHGLGSHTVPVSVRRIAAGIAKPLLAAVGACGAGYVCAASLSSPPAALAAGGAVATAAFTLLALLLDAAGARSLAHAALLPVRRSLTGKPRHGR
ncbi:murein biosynthesis integral membrane protein MurJ [Streptomyces polyrhachis]|uniref:Murein biosynthesis integral membrane protein MurJ n=1 Tax=Streptomyces polyrhachis TaxID=1282885 RepID=A0ABW2GLX9_9ACTN